MYQEKVLAEVEKIVGLFKDGTIEDALETVYVNKARNSIPMYGWSISNMLLALLHGATDARTYKAWQDVGRQVKKGEKSFNILVPNMKKVKTKSANGDEVEEVKNFGFLTSPRFDISQTDGQDLPEIKDNNPIDFNSLPFYDYAKKKGITVIAYNSQLKEKGFYQPDTKMIGMAVKNENTWLHELYHAVEDELGLLTSDKVLNEVSAQLGASLIARLIGRDDIADLGKTYNYVKHWGNAKTNEEVASLCMKVIGRVSKTIDYLLNDNNN